MANGTLFLNNSKELDLLLGYLQFPPKSIEISKKKKQGCLTVKGPVLRCSDVNVSGSATVAKHLARISEELSSSSSDEKPFAGSSSFEKAEIQQWLHYCETHVKPCCPENLNLLHTEAEWLNDYLADKAFFVGNYFTLADLMLFQSLHPYMASQTFAEKEKFIHLSRWFDQVQHIPRTRHRLALVNFHMTKLY